MQISFATPDRALKDFRAGAFVVGIAEGGVLTPAAERADKATGGAVRRAMKRAAFKGRSCKYLEIVAPPGIGASRILLAGLGKGADFHAATAERLAADALARLSAAGEEQITFALEAPKGAKLAPAALAAHTALGAKLRAYRFDAYRTKKDEDAPKLKSVVVVTRAERARESWKALSAVAEGVCLARDLVNEPPNVLYPDAFARRARALSKLGVKVRVFAEPELRKLGMNTLLGVGQGSTHGSRMVTMEWNGAPGSGKKAAPLAFIGKGVCFDSGGLSLKQPNSMVGMKGDMAGAAAVVGLMHALAKRKARVHAVGLIGLTENMPDGKAQRPNDVVKTLSGQMVEILNTDAEGRLVLADVLTYARTHYKPKFMIDLATLTGAILVALGTETAGLFSNDDTLSERLTRAGLEEGEPVWRLPLGDAYDKLLKSKIADFKNVGGPNAGSITAAQFLQRFVDKVPWAHLDIAGVAWQDHEQKPLIPSWGTGWGVRILNRLIAAHYER